MRHFPVGTLHGPNWDEEKGKDFSDRIPIVETRGYMTLRQQIERALAAGILYENWKREHFPADFDIPDDYEPPGYQAEEQDLYAEYQLIVDGRSRTMARLEQAQRKKEAEENRDPEPVKNPLEKAPEEPEA